MSTSGKGIAGSTFAGQPMQSWMFGLRIWTAMTAALYAAFWLQLQNAASAAVTVGILALPTRGQALQKAGYRFTANWVGVAASIAIVGLFPQSRDLFIAAFAMWLGVCVFLAGFLDGNRAYGAVLCGYTVAVVAVQQIDAPQSVFLSAVERGAAITVGIAALAVTNDLFLAPELSRKLDGAFALACDHVRRFAIETSDRREADPVRSARLLQEITALHADVTALPTESLKGQARAYAARNLLVALASEVHVIRRSAYVPRPTLDDPTTSDAGSDGANSKRGRPAAARTSPDPDGVRGTTSWPEQALRDFRAERMPTLPHRNPLYRSSRAAYRNGLRSTLAMIVAAIPFVLSGWPATSQGYSLVGVTLALSAINPKPAAFAAGALIAMPMAAACAGITEFLILDGVDQFPLLGLAMAPTVFLGAMLLNSGNPKRVGIGALLLVFFPVLLGPSNPQSYDPQTYVFAATLATTAVVALYIILATMLPTSDALRRRWITHDIRRDLAAASDGKRSRYRAGEATFRDADRIGQLAGLNAEGTADHVAGLRDALRLFDLTVAIRTLNGHLQGMHDGMHAVPVGAVRRALAQRNSTVLRRAAGELAEPQSVQHPDEDAARIAADDLNYIADLIDDVDPPPSFDTRAS